MMFMQSILSASQSIARVQTMQSARVQMQGQANVLRIESKQDGGNSKKDELAQALDEKSNGLMEGLMQEVTDANEALKPDEDVTAEEEAAEAAKQPKTDKLELSSAATEQSGEASAAKVAVGEPVAYKADGTTTPSAGEEKSHKMSLTA